MMIDIAINGGSGYHLDYLLYNAPQKLERFLVDVFVLQLLYYIFVNVPKLAVLVLYHRLFSVRKYISWVTTALSIILVVYTIISVLLTIFACGTHVDSYWNLPLSEAGCIDVDALQVYTSIPNIVTDVLILLVPMPALWNLHVRLSVKIGIALTFLIGSL
jgi:hypothetical protein